MVPSSAKSAACTGKHVEEHATQFHCCCRITALMAAQVFKRYCLEGRCFAMKQCKWVLNPQKMLLQPILLHKLNIGSAVVHSTVSRHCSYVEFNSNNAIVTKADHSMHSSVM